MTNAQRILDTLDRALRNPVELTLYGRAALQLGFSNPPVEYLLSKDVDAVLWLGQAEELAEKTNFWEALEETNKKLAEAELYISHLFEEDQVVLTPAWREQRVAIPGDWRHLRVMRLGDTDLLLTKLMRDDPIDHADALFIFKRSGLPLGIVRQAIEAANIPDVPEIRDQFLACSNKFLTSIGAPPL